jgi:hypothetical protein
MEDEIMEGEDAAEPLAQPAEKLGDDQPTPDDGLSGERIPIQPSPAQGFEIEQ